MAIKDYLDKMIYFGNQTYNIFIPIHTIKVSNTRSKKLRKRNPGKSSQKSDTNPVDTKISDRLKVENVYEVDGYIEPIGANDTDDFYFPTEKTAKEVKDDFIKYVFNENTKLQKMYMGYENRIFFGAVEKVDITEEAMDKTTQTPTKYSIKFIFIATNNRII